MDDTTLSALSVAERLEKSITEIREALPGLELMENEPMSRHCSFKVGGPVRCFAAPQSVTSLSKICSILKDNRLMPYILGNGTNVVFPDEGLPQIFVLSTEKLQNLFILPPNPYEEVPDVPEDSGEKKDTVCIYAEAGISLSRLAGFAYENGLAGLEFASGIPGTVGGGTMMNAGAYGGELKDVIDSAVCYYLPEQRLYELNNQQCDFSYRKSVFQTMPGCLLLSAVFRLTKGDKDEISAKMKELNERRREKQPLDLPSAGSAFRRPEGYYAAALIEECGLKGYTVGGAQVSEKHAGFIVNKGNATAKDVYDVMDHVRRTVHELKGVTLAPEIILLSPEYVLEDNGPKACKHFVNGGMSFLDENK